MGVADTLYDGSYYNRSVTIDLIQVIRGRVWRIGTGYQTVAQNGYVTFNFTTPATGRVTYSFMDIAKSGGEVTVKMLAKDAVTLAATLDLIYQPSAV